MAKREGFEKSGRGPTTSHRRHMVLIYGDCQQIFGSRGMSIAWILKPWTATTLQEIRKDSGTSKVLELFDSLLKICESVQRYEDGRARGQQLVAVNASVPFTIPEPHFTGGLSRTAVFYHPCVAARQRLQVSELQEPQIQAPLVLSSISNSKSKGTSVPTCLLTLNSLCVAPKPAQIAPS